jgi:hypothetical protein
MPDIQRQLPLAKYHKLMFRIGLFLVLVPAILHAYCLMPFPGSQNLETMTIAYYLEKLLVPARIIGGLLLVLPVVEAVMHGTRRRRIWLVVLTIFSGAITWGTDYFISAERMFREPEKLVFATVALNKIPLDMIVVGVEQNGATRAYPIDFIGYHHKVLDRVGGVPVLVTYCTMCRTARVFSPVVGGHLQHFRLVGARHWNAIVEDEETGTWWYQATGEGAVGPRAGESLTELPYEQMSLRAWIAIHPETTVMQPDPAFKDHYESMKGYDRERPGKESGVDSAWRRRSWVVGIVVGKEAKAYVWDDLLREWAINDIVGTIPLVVALEPDSLSFHTWQRTVNSQTLLLTADPDGKGLVDTASGSHWNWRGECVAGPYIGTALVPIQSYQEYWHAWKNFHKTTTQWTGNAKK